MWAAVQFVPTWNPPSESFLWCLGAQSGDAAVGFRVMGAAGGLAIFYRPRNSTTHIHVGRSTGVLSSKFGKVVTAVMVIDSHHSNGMRLWVDGVELANDYQPIAGSGGVPLNEQLWESLGNLTRGIAPGQVGDCSNVALMSCAHGTGVLSDEEVQRISSNFYCLVQPKQAWMPVYGEPTGTTASVADTTSAAELLSIFVGATLSEQASADMAFGGAAGAAVADAAAGTDAAAVLVQLTALDSATGAETTIASCSAGLADAAQGVDAIALFAATLVQLLDAAAGTDAVLAGVQAAVADTAVAVDQPGAAVLAALLDAGLAADQLQLQVHVALAELGGGGDAVAVLQEALRTVADAVAATDGVTAAVELQLTDTGAAAELLALAAQLQLLEQTVGLDIAVQLSPTTPRKVRLVFRQAHRRMLFSLRQRQAVFRPS